MCVNYFATFFARWSVGKQFSNTLYFMLCRRLWRDDCLRCVYVLLTVKFIHSIPAHRYIQKSVYINDANNNYNNVKLCLDAAAVFFFFYLPRAAQTRTLAIFIRGAFYAFLDFRACTGHRRLATANFPSTFLIVNVPYEYDHHH